MKNKKNIILIIFIFIVGIQSLLFLNNKQKTSFKYLIWNIQDITIGKLICISFISGFAVSNLVNVLSINNDSNQEIINEDENYMEEDFLVNENNITNEIPPQRDIRDTQPTISVNYRVIKNNSVGDPNNRQVSNRINSDYDDWYSQDKDW